MTVTARNIFGSLAATGLILWITLYINEERWQVVVENQVSAYTFIDMSL